MIRIKDKPSLFHWVPVRSLMSGIFRGTRNVPRGILFKARFRFGETWTEGLAYRRDSVNWTFVAGIAPPPPTGWWYPAINYRYNMPWYTHHSLQDAQTSWSGFLAEETFLGNPGWCDAENLFGIRVRNPTTERLKDFAGVDEIQIWLPK